jgi:hypothetical protein
MLKLKRGTAAIALVLSLGLIVPAFFGGPALADVKPPPNDNVRNPQYVETVFHCDLNGDADDGDGGDGYETAYELVSTFGAKMWQDKKSSTILVQRLRVDVKDSHYEVVQDPTGDAVAFDDPDAYWFDSPGGALPNGGNPKGWQTVRCTEIVEYGYSPFPSEATPEFNEEHDLSFVQTDECEVFGDLEDPSEVDDCVTYLVTETNLYDVTISGNGPKAKSASADGAPSADRAVKAKHGKQRGKGKRGR